MHLDETLDRPAALGFAYPHIWDTCLPEVPLQHVCTPGLQRGCHQQVFQVTGLESPDVTRSTYTFGDVTLTHFFQGD